jgi:hypothetical protein
MAEQTAAPDASASQHDEIQYYATQSPMTDPGRFADRMLAVPGTLSEIREAARQLVFHYRADGDFAENGIEASRICEIDIRYAEDMLARIFELSDAPLTAEREPRQRMVGCCRDFTVLFLSMARAHGIPARARVGFGAYFQPGWYLDHVVAEVWDAGEQRWRLVDPELAPDHADPSGRPLDSEDLTGAQFVTGPHAWLACRSGSADPERFVVDPGLDIPPTRGWWYLRHNLVLDLSALTRREMVQWDGWGLTDVAEPTSADLALLDDLAAATAGDVTPELAASWSEHEGLAVPPVVTSYSPAAEVPLQVTLRA